MIEIKVEIRNGLREVNSKFFKVIKVRLLSKLTDRCWFRVTILGDQFLGRSIVSFEKL